MDCEHGQDKLSLALEPGQASGFRMRRWREMWRATARRTGEKQIQLDLQLPNAERRRSSRKMSLQLGAAITLVPGRDVNAANVGGSLEPIRCAWVE